MKQYTHRTLGIMNVDSIKEHLLNPALDILDCGAKKYYAHAFADYSRILTFTGVYRIAYNIVRNNPIACDFETIDLAIGQKRLSGNTYAEVIQYLEGLHSGKDPQVDPKSITVKKMDLLWQ